MPTAFLYDAEGTDREVELTEEAVESLGEQNLLWVDVDLAAGDDLVLVARRRDRLEDLAAQIQGKVHVFDADLALADAGIVDEGVDLEPEPLHLLDQLLRSARPGEIGGDDMARAELGRQGLEPVAAAGDEDELVAALAALAGKLDSETGRSAGDDGYPHVRPLMFSSSARP